LRAMFVSLRRCVLKGAVTRVVSRRNCRSSDSPEVSEIGLEIGLGSRVAIAASADSGAG